MFRTEALWITAFLAIGMIGGLVYNWPSDPDAKPLTGDPSGLPAKVEQPQEGPMAPQQVNRGAVGETLPEAERINDPWAGLADVSAAQTQALDLSALQIGDQFLLGGNHLGAYQHYEKLWGQANSPADASILLRMGLAAEQAGLPAEAERHYRAAIRVSRKGQPNQIWSLLGIARVWEKLARGETARYGDAISLLSELYLMYGSSSQPKDIRLAINRQLGDCLQRRLLTTPAAQKAMAAQPLEYFYCPLLMEPMVAPEDMVDSQSGASSASVVVTATLPNGITVLQNPRGETDLITIQAKLSGTPALNVIQELQQKTQIQITATSGANSAMLQRYVRTEVDAITLPLWLDLVLDPMSLIWTSNQSGVLIQHRHEISGQDLASYELARTQRALRQLQMSFSEGIERVAAMLNDGNNCRIDAQFDIAADKYRAAREMGVGGELSAKLYFNEASLMARKSSNATALGACYLALDQTLSPHMQARSYGLIARMELDLGRPDNAIVAASRGIRQSNDPSIANETLMTLARSYLLSGDLLSANQALFDHAAALTAPRQRRLASVFSSYCRFRSMAPKKGLQDEGERLVMALAALQPDDVRSYADGLIVAQAFNKIGLGTRALDNLRDSLANSPPGYWNNRIRMELAVQHYESSNFEAASGALDGFDAENVEAPSFEMKLAIMRIRANIFLHHNEASLCEAISRQMLDLVESSELQSATPTLQPSSSESIVTQAFKDEVKADALDLLGQSLQLQGKHYAAALCFAGLLPESDASRDSISPAAAL